MVKFEPVPKTDPPVAAEYQVSVPPEQPVAERSTVPGPHREEGTPVGAMGIGFTVATTGARGPSQLFTVQET